MRSLSFAFLLNKVLKIIGKRWVSEVLMLIKTSTARAQEVQSAIASLHSYEVPEYLVLPILGGSNAYLAWLGASLD